MTRAAWGLAALCTSIAAMAPARAERADDTASRDTPLARIARIAEEQARRALERAPDGALLVRIRRTFPEDAPKPEALERAVVAPWLDTLRASRPVHVEHPRSGGPEGKRERTVARAAARGFEAVLFVELAARGGRLALELEAWATGGAGFRGLVAPSPRRTARHARAIPLDAHLRTFVGRAPRLTADTLVARTAALPSRGYVALHATDLGGDARSEVIAVTRERVHVLRLRGGAPGLQLEAVADAKLPRLPLAAAPSRRPIGAAVTLGDRTLVRLSDHGQALSLRLDKDRLQLAPGETPCTERAAIALPDGCAVRAEGRDFFGPTLQARTDLDDAPRRAPGSFYARRMRHVRRPDGSVQRVEAVVTPGGRLAVRVEGEASGAVGYGAALGLADVDQDGTAEMLASDASAPGEGDMIRVLRVRSDGAVIAVWESGRLQGSVGLAASGDVDGDGQAELLAVEEPAGDESTARLWVVQ